MNRATARAPDGRTWTVQRVWWPRPNQIRLQTEVAQDAVTGYAGLGVVFAAIFFCVLVVLWPLVLAVRILVRARFLVEARPENNFGVEGAAWRVRGWGRSGEVVEEIARAITAGDRRPEPHGAKPVAFARRPPKAATWDQLR